MNELLAPAGTLESFYAAISNGANAIYLGLDKYSARAYADNFTTTNLKELVNFAHLRNIKIYVTINTIIYDNELEDCYKTIDELANINVDAIIVQDLAILHYITSHYSSIDAHISTQFGIDDVDGAIIAKELGASRIVLARETSLDTIKEIKDKVSIELETFIHGALCVGYSGNCLMSSSIGERSGNRGRCAGCCRKIYSLIDAKTNKTINTRYLLSMKDLNTSEYINKMRFIDSFKIEGRMKEPSYVAAVTRYYRNLIDKENTNTDALNKVFNRTYTKGFINNEDSLNITNIDKPNNFGYRVGTVDRWSKNKVWIKLIKPLNKGDQIRIDNGDIKDEISIHIDKLYDSSFNSVQYMTRMAIVDCDIKVNQGDKVYVTRDNRFYNDIKQTLLPKEYSKLDIDMEFNGSIGKPFMLKITFNNKTKVFAKSSWIIENATTAVTTKDEITTLLSRLNDTPYKIRNIIVNIDDNSFIPLKYINDIRREAIDKLNQIRLDNKPIKKESSPILPPKHDLLDKKEICVEVSNDKQYEIAKELGIKHIYYKNIVRRNNARYIEDTYHEILVGGYGSINHYRNSLAKIVSDYSFNITNYVSIALLHSLNVNRITLSQEINLESINNLVENYYSYYQTYPNLELIVYGKTKLMHTKYCVLKRLGMCGKCKESLFKLKDEYSEFPLVFNDDCTMTILNGKTLNNIDDINKIKGVNYIRLVFSNEDENETRRIIQMTINKLNGNDEIVFDSNNNTRGHFNNNPL